MASALTARTTLEDSRPRPPTPPRDTTQPADDRLELKALRPTSVSHLNLQTPPSVHSPAASNKSGSGAGRMGKRVVWSGQNEIREASTFPDQSSPAPPSSAQSKAPLKSILKPSAPTAASAIAGIEVEEFNLDMLDSNIRQLAGQDRDSRIDAYASLNSGIKGTTNLPDRVALQTKMSLLVDFIQRDYLAKNQDGTIDSTLVKLALTLLVSFLQFPSIASMIPFEFGATFIDHSIKALEDSNTPKDIARYLMQVGSYQSFGPKVMTSDRVGRLVASLHSIEDNVKGKSIVMARITFYKKLIKQARSHMVVHSDWLKDMFVDMLSTIKDIQANAIQLGLEAGFMFHKDHKLYRQVTDILGHVNNEDQLYVDFYFDKLREWLMDKDKEGRKRLLHVPQILSVISLFLPCPLDRWNHYERWLELLQMSFNCSDWHTKHQANFAWNRYVYLSLKDGKSGKALPSTLLSTLSLPLKTQLRTGKRVSRQGEEGKRLRKTLIGGMCNLYYYALKQSGRQQLKPDIIWDVAVQPIIELLTDRSYAGYAEDSVEALRILVRLLDVSTPTLWREDRIQEQMPVNPDELPSIEAKWIKQNPGRVFAAITPILQEKFVDLATKSSLTYKLWQAVIKSVKQASVKEIKVSPETAKWLAQSLGLLFGVWKKGWAATEDASQGHFFQSARNFIDILVEHLGILPWTECKLSMTVSHTLEPLATPSHRPKNGVGRKPLHHLFIELSKLPPRASDDEAFSEFFQDAFQPFINNKSDKARLDLTRELLSLLPPGTLSPYGPWALESQAVQLLLSTNDSAKLTFATAATGTEFREIVHCLCNGLTLHPNLPATSWLSLYEPFVQKVKAAVGAPGLALAVIEPLAKVLEEGPKTTSDLILAASRVILECAELPSDRKALEAARHRLWGSGRPGSAKGGDSADPYNHLYKFANSRLGHCYENLDDYTEDQAASFLKALDSFLSRTSGAGLAILANFNEGLSRWICNNKAHEKLAGDSQLSATLREFWANICARVMALGQLDKKQFDLIEDLLAAGFKSTHRSIVDKTTETWNVIAKDEDGVECSDSLKSIVSSVRSRPEEVETAAEQSTDGFGAQATSYPGSHNNNTIVISTSTTHETPSAAPELPEPAEELPSSKRKRQHEAEWTPTRRVSKCKYRPPSRAGTPRLRHDDSQIQFQPIAASSSPMLGESQHLTERQQEVRDKQKSNAAMYPQMRTSSPPAAADDPTAKEKEAEETKQDELTRHSTPIRITPERKSTYSELISSTPTPRRGQVFLLEGENDVPSSPPEPRSNPLASEIQSRSQANSSIGDWDFESSPPASPVTSRQQVAQEAELPQVTLTNESPIPTVSANEHQDAPREPTPSPDVIPSSLPPVEPPARSTRARARAARSESIPFTPPPKQQQRPTGPAEPSSSKNNDEDFVDAKSNQEPSSPVLPMLPAEADPMETSYTFSQVADDSQLAKFVVEFDARAANAPQIPLSNYVPSSSPVKQDIAHPKSEAVSEHLEEHKENAQEVQAKAAPLEAADESFVDSSQGGKKNKRKRSKAAVTSRKNKRRRSTEPSSSQPAPSESSQQVEVPESPVPASQASQTSQPSTKTKKARKAQATSQIMTSRRSLRVLAKEIEAGEVEEVQATQEKGDENEDEEESMELEIPYALPMAKAQETHVQGAEVPEVGAAVAEATVAEHTEAKVLEAEVQETGTPETEVQDIPEVEIPTADVQEARAQGAELHMDEVQAETVAEANIGDAPNNEDNDDDNIEDEAGSSDRDTDEELHSQLYEESIAASESRSASREASVFRDATEEMIEEASVVLFTIRDSVDVDATGENPVGIKAEVEQQQVPELEQEAQLEEEQQQVPAEEAPQEEEPASNKAESIIARLRATMDDISSASLSRDEYNKIEDMLFDMKGDLLAAERRGRA